jgi:hypothetical protein
MRNPVAHRVQPTPAGRFGGPLAQQGERLIHPVLRPAWGSASVRMHERIRASMTGRRRTGARAWRAVYHGERDEGGDHGSGGAGPLSSSRELPLPHRIPCSRLSYRQPIENMLHYAYRCSRCTPTVEPEALEAYEAIERGCSQQWTRPLSAVSVSSGAHPVSMSRVFFVPFITILMGQQLQTSHAASMLCRGRAPRCGRAVSHYSLRPLWNAPSAITPVTQRRDCLSCGRTCDPIPSKEIRIFLITELMVWTHPSVHPRGCRS